MSFPCLTFDKILPYNFHFITNFIKFYHKATLEVSIIFINRSFFSTKKLILQTNDNNRFNNQMSLPMQSADCQLAARNTLAQSRCLTCQI